MKVGWAWTHLTLVVLAGSPGLWAVPPVVPTVLWDPWSLGRALFGVSHAVSGISPF